MGGDDSSTSETEGGAETCGDCVSAEDDKIFIGKDQDGRDSEEQVRLSSLETKIVKMSWFGQRSDVHAAGGGKEDDHCAVDRVKRRQMIHWGKRRQLLTC